MVASMSYHTHPILPCGFNADDINGDETNGAGTNWVVSPVLFDSFVGLTPLIMTSDMFAAFDECPDLTIPCENDTVVFPAGPRVLKIRRAA